MIINDVHTSMGVTISRKILSFSQQYHDNYYIYEYTFKNTGIIDGTKVKKLNKTLTGVVFYIQNRLSFAGESYTTSGNGGWAPATTTWGETQYTMLLDKIKIINWQHQMISELFFRIGDRFHNVFWKCIS